MQGRYAGCHMTIYGTILPGAASIAAWANRVQSLTPRAKWRIKVLDWHKAHQNNVSLTARHFGITRYTVRVWQKRFRQFGIMGLNDRSHRPKHLRQPTTAWQIISQTVQLRRQYPAWSKYKLQILLRRQGMHISASTIGRILKRKGLISPKASRKRKRAALWPKARFPHGLKISRPGDMIQIDTKHEHLVGGRKIYQFTAIDVLTKTRVLRYYPSLTSRHGAHFLHHCLKRFPFRVQAVQTDNGSEFLKEFDNLCRQKALTHYFIVPRTPKQNTYVEISHEADQKEFYQQGNTCSNLEVMQKKLRKHEQIWNEIRPHERLNYLTPKEYFLKWQQGRLPTKDVITLQT